MTSFDVLGIGNAIVDVLSLCEEKALERLSLRKGSMELIDEARAEALYAQMGPATECSGGSAANTLAGLASLGASTAFIGKVRDDQLGNIFRHDMRSAGVHFTTQAAASGPATARCLIFITPDAQRTMNTFIGACAHVSEEDIDETLIAKSGTVYIEGYLWDQPQAKAAIGKALKLARGMGKRTAFSLSDTFCVERHRDAFLSLIEDGLEVLFANEAELCALAKRNTLEEACAAMRGKCPVIVATRGAEGAVVLAGEETYSVPAERVSPVVDTTGAGDLFAGGFLYGLSKGRSPEHCAALGNRCAGNIIQQIGARSATSLASLAA